jgi:hypothetical protein
MGKRTHGSTNLMEWLANRLAKRPGVPFATGCFDKGDCVNPVGASFRGRRRAVAAPSRRSFLWPLKDQLQAADGSAHPPQQ